MALTVTRNILDFEVLETGNEFTLVIVDSSQYMEYPEKPLLEVTFPGFDKFTLVPFNASSVNTFNSNTLGFNNALGLREIQILPDGIWHIRYKVCPYQYTFIDKCIIRTTILEKKIQEGYNGIDLLKCENKSDKHVLDQLTRANILVIGAKSIVSQDPTRAFEYYQLAEKIVETVLNKFCKNCRSWDAPIAGIGV